MHIFLGLTTFARCTSGHTGMYLWPNRYVPRAIQVCASGHIGYVPSAAAERCLCSHARLTIASDRAFLPEMAESGMLLIDS